MDTLRNGLLFMAAAVLVACTPTPALAVVAVTDSIGAKPDSWPEVLRRDYGYFMKTEGQSMRFAINWDFPEDWLAGVDGHRTLVYALGTNDARAPEFIERYKQAVKVHIATALARGYRLVIVAPATLELIDTTDHRAWLLQHCNTLRLFSAPVACYDPDDMDYLQHTTDGVHPTPLGSQLMAQGIAAKIAEVEQ